jgi:hypothetical protein
MDSTALSIRTRLGLSFLSGGSSGFAAFLPAAARVNLPDAGVNFYILKAVEAAAVCAIISFLLVFFTALRVRTARGFRLLAVTALPVLAAAGFLYGAFGPLPSFLI